MNHTESPTRPDDQTQRPDKHPHKRAQSDVPLTELLAARWSPRAFAETPVEEEKLLGVLEAARWAASSSNVQPWRFLVTRRGTDAFDKLRGCLSEGNKPWTAQVPVLILTVTDTVLPAKGEKPATENRYALHDLGLAVGNLTVQATALELFVHQMAGFSADKAKAAFEIPDPYKPVSVIALGYLGDDEALPEDLRARENAPRVRKTLKEIAFEAEWGKPAFR